MGKGLFYGVFAATFMIFAAGCGKQPDPPSVAKYLCQPFQSAVSVDWDGWQCTADLKSDPPSAFSFSFDTPSLLEGLVISVEEDQVTVEYRGLTGNYQPDDLPQKSAASLLTKSLQAALEDENLTFQEEGEQLLISGRLTADHAAFQLLWDMQTHTPVKISVPEWDFTATFSSFSYT